jgi:hypothetical protein
LVVTAASDPLINRSRNLSIPLAGGVLMNQMQRAYPPERVVMRTVSLRSA